MFEGRVSEFSEKNADFGEVVGEGVELIVGLFCLVGSL